MKQAITLLLCLAIYSLEPSCAKAQKKEPPLPTVDQRCLGEEAKVTDLLDYYLEGEVKDGKLLLKKVDSPDRDGQNLATYIFGNSPILLGWATSGPRTPSTRYIYGVIEAHGNVGETSDRWYQYRPVQAKCSEVRAQIIDSLVKNGMYGKKKSDFAWK